MDLIVLFLLTPEERSCSEQVQATQLCFSLVRTSVEDRRTPSEGKV